MMETILDLLKKADLRAQWKMNGLLKDWDPEGYYALWKGDKDYLKHKEEAWKDWRNKNSGKMKEIEREASKLVLKKEIQQLEKIANRTPEEEQELQTKRAELARLEAQIDEQKQPTNWTPWISLGIVLQSLFR